ncbi:MAG: hypothetical protein U0V70_17165 [Terriglobia bacterium]
MAIDRVGGTMFKKSLTIQLLFLWVTLHLLAPYTAFCTKICATPAPQAAAAVPPSHGCCLKDFKPCTEIKTSPGCICPSLMRKAARLETGISLVSPDEKVKIQPLATSAEGHASLSKPLNVGTSPPGFDNLLPLHHATALSILRI